jgi:hypothetical protein
MAKPQRTHGRQESGGKVYPSEPFHPAMLPDDSGPADEGAPRPSPGPHVPVSAETYLRLKEQAKRRRTGTSPHAQRDPAGRK